MMKEGEGKVVRKSDKITGTPAHTPSAVVTLKASEREQANTKKLKQIRKQQLEEYFCWNPQRRVPLPRAPRIQHTRHMTNVTHDTCYLVQVPRIPTWSDLTRSLVGLGRKTLLPFSLALM